MQGGLVEHFQSLPFVEHVVPILKPYKLVGKAFKPEGTIINVRVWELLHNGAVGFRRLIDLFGGKPRISGPLTLCVLSRPCCAKL